MELNSRFKITKRLIAVIVFIFLLSSCDRNSTIKEFENATPFNLDSMIAVNQKRYGVETPKREIITNSLNGTVFYIYEMDSTVGEFKKSHLFKYEDQAEFYRIFIKNDTIQLGEAFEGFIHLNDNTKLYIWDQMKEENVLAYHPEEKNFYKYKVTPTRKGIYTFKGLIEVNFKGMAENNPFEYKYVVVE